MKKRLITGLVGGDLLHRLSDWCSLEGWLSRKENSGKVSKK